MKPHISKADEYAWLDRAIGELGNDTYLGPLLQRLRNDIQWSIQSDIMPEADWRKLIAAQDQLRQSIVALQKERDALETAVRESEARVSHAQRTLAQLRQRFIELQEEAQFQVRRLAA